MVGPIFKHDHLVILFTAAERNRTAVYSSVHFGGCEQAFMLKVFEWNSANRCGAHAALDILPATSASVDTDWKFGTELEFAITRRRRRPVSVTFRLDAAERQFRQIAGSRPLYFASALFR